MENYEHLCCYRDEPIEDINRWFWIKSDHGAWEGPKSNWINDHRKNIQKYCMNWATAISVGGNQGMYPCLLSKLFRVVYTFEPDPLNFFVLSRNCQNDNIIKIQAALGNEHRMICVYRASMENTGMHRVDEVPKGIIPMLKIDDFVFEELNLLHIDVEGYEHKVLLGAEHTIDKHRPLIMAENGNKTEIAELLAKYNYHNVGQSVSDTIYVQK